MARGEQVLRHWNLLKMLQTRGEGVPLSQLADEFEVSERTIQRDFELLEELGFPIEHDDDPYGKRFWRLPHDFFRTGPLVLSLTEAISLHLAEQLVAPLTGTHLADGLQLVLDKIRNSVPAAALEHFRGLDDLIHVRRAGTTNYREQADIVRVLAHAASSQETVELAYRSLWRGEQYTMAFDPYGMVYYDGDLFVVGWSHRAQGIRNLKVIRIQSAAGVSRRFDKPAEFSLEACFRHSFGITQTDDPPQEVIAKFHGPVAGLVEERVWHESQELERLPTEETLFESLPDEPDCLIARFTLANMVEFKQWIRRFGPDAEVLKPAWLRAEMHAELLAAAERHA